jgi:DNA-binding response OmpR family regulator
MSNSCTCPLCGSPIQTPELILGPDYGAVIRDKQVVMLTPKEYALFDCLHRARTSVVSKDRLMESMYGDGDEPDWKILDQFLHRMRKKLVKLGISINVVRNEGYYLRFDPV